MNSTTEPLFPRAVPINYVHTLHELFRHREEEVSYAYLMGISGEAFRFFYSRSDPEVGMNTFFHNPLRATCRALGYKYEVLHDDNYQSAAQRLQENMRAGKPALIPFGDSCPFLREDTRSETLICQNSRRYELNAKDLPTKWQPGGGFLELGPQGYYQFVIGEREREPQPREAALGALRGACKLMLTRQRIRGCAMGLAAYREIVVHLRGMFSRKKKVTLRDVHRIAKWNGHPISQAIQMRQAAVEYLQLIRKEFQSEELEHLDKATTLYRQVSTHLEKLQSILPPAEPSPHDTVPSNSEQRLELGLGLFRFWGWMTIDPQLKAQQSIIKMFKSKCRAAVKVLEQIVGAETKAINEIERVLQISEKLKM